MSEEAVKIVRVHPSGVVELDLPDSKGKGKRKHVFLYRQLIERVGMRYAMTKIPEEAREPLPDSAFRKLKRLKIINGRAPATMLVVPVELAHQASKGRLAERLKEPNA